MGYDGTFIKEIVEQSHKTQELTEREKHLIGLGVTMTRGCVACTTRRIQDARDFGLSDVALNELTRVVAAVNAGVAARTAAQAFDNSDYTEAVCDDGSCSVPSTGNNKVIS